MQEQQNNVSPADEASQVPSTEQLHHVNKKSSSVKSRVIWSILFVAIAALTIWAITSQKGFSFGEFVVFLGSLHPGWLIAAILSMLGIVFFEGCAVLTIIRSFGYKKNPLHGFVYASGDIYFSAITPSASGGQPASAYFMMKDGVPGSITTMALVLNLVCYMLSILSVCIIGFFLNPSIFFSLSLIPKILVIVGTVVLCFAAVTFVFVLYKGRVLQKIGDAVLSVLAKLHLVRNVGKKQERLARAIRSYETHVSKLGGKRCMIVRVFIFNVLQRVATIAVTIFAFLASGGSLSTVRDIWVSQCLTVLGSNTIPVPGAMGVSDYILIDSFNSVGLSEAVAVNLDILSRAISFYFCVILCALVMIIRLISYKVIAQKKKKSKQQ